MNKSLTVMQQNLFTKLFILDYWTRSFGIKKKTSAPPRAEWITVAKKQRERM